MNYRKLAMDHYKNHICVWCMNGNKAILQVAHIDGDNTNHKLGNLGIACGNCHRLLDLGLIQRKMFKERRRFIETMPEADWKILMKDAGAKAAATRKRNQSKRIKK